MSYLLHVPRNHGGKPTALLVMLHGCSQTPEDFAAGTRMNEFADAHGFLVVYPAQTAQANPLHCWNWFERKDQFRDRGEPRRIADLARTMASTHRVDTRRIFVAGLSAGGAMAVILGTTYPDLFAAIGVHSGLPYGAAHDATTALLAMRGDLPARGPGLARATAAMVRTIVFHGDADTTVAAGNGVAIAAQAVQRVQQDGGGPLHKLRHEGTTTGGRVFTNTAYRRADGTPMVELWQIRGAGHAWSGGSTQGSFTDPDGPDASAEMVRFFLARPHLPAAASA